MNMDANDRSVAVNVHVSNDIECEELKGTKSRRDHESSKALASAEALFSAVATPVILICLVRGQRVLQSSLCSGEFHEGKDFQFIP